MPSSIPELTITHDFNPEFSPNLGNVLGSEPSNFQQTLTFNNDWEIAEFSFNNQQKYSQSFDSIFIPLTNHTRENPSFINLYKRRQSYIDSLETLYKCFLLQPQEYKWITKDHQIIAEQRLVAIADFRGQLESWASLKEAEIKTNLQKIYSQAREIINTGLGHVAFCPLVADTNTIDAVKVSSLRTRQSNCIVMGDDPLVEAKMYLLTGKDLHRDDGLESHNYNKK